MTEVTFHFSVPDRTDYTCRLLRKAVRRGAVVVVAGAQPTLAEVDRALWAFDPVEFLPHVLLRADEAVSARARAAPVWLLEDARQTERHEVLVNLGAEAPPGFESFARLIEIVSLDGADRAQARLRLKHYQARGYAIKLHEANPP